MKSISMGAKRTNGTISDHRRKKRKKKIVATVTHPKWSDLHQDFIRCFAEQIVSMKDFFAFRGVNRSWRSEAIKENSNAALRLQHKVPILLLSQEINAPIRNIYSLTKGWLLAVPQDYSKLNLFNPLTHAHIELLPLRPGHLMKKFVLSSSPSWTSNYEVLLLSNVYLSIYKPGFNNGTWKDTWSKEASILMDALYYKGQFYLVDYHGRVFVCEIEDPNNTQLRLVAPHIPQELLFGIEVNRRELRFLPRSLVESATGALLLVLSLYDTDGETTIGFRVFEVPFDNGKSWTKSQVINLGNRTLFLGANNSSFSIEPSDDSVCKANCIYYLNRSEVSTRGDIDIGIYSTEDGKIDRHLETLPDFKYKGSSLTSHSWLQPSF